MDELILPWPPKECSPNARVHWSKRSKAAKAYRQLCWALAKQAAIQAPDGALALWIDFYPPDRRQRDDDNLIAAFKSGRDGIAEALGINDKRFQTIPTMHDKTGGYVVVRITKALQREKEAA